MPSIPDTLVVSIPDTLKFWRGNLRDYEYLTREVVATAARVTSRTVENWERGAGEPGIDQLRALEKLRPGLLAALGLVARAPAKKKTKRRRA